MYTYPWFILNGCLGTLCIHADAGLMILRNMMEIAKLNLDNN